MKCMNRSGAHAALLMTLVTCCCLTGCFDFLKPAPDTTRHFVLTPLHTLETANVAPGAPGVGVGHMKIPAYLLEASLAERKGANEIDYSRRALWAERLDNGIPRVLAANLSSLLPTDQIRLPVWRSEDVRAEIYVTIEQFDVTPAGQGVLIARWRILASSSGKTLRTGDSSLSRPGPSPEANPAGAVATLSELLVDLSRQLAHALQEILPGATVSRGN
jgi:uncharacterized protein